MLRKILLCAVAVSALGTTVPGDASLANSKVVFRSGKWAVHRDNDAMTDKVSCTGIYDNDFSIQLTEDSLYIKVRGGPENIITRIDDQPAAPMRLLSEIEQRIDAADIQGDLFHSVLSGRRLRTQSLTRVSGIAEKDLDLTGIKDAYDNILAHCPDAAVAASAPTAETPVQVSKPKCSQEMRDKLIEKQMSPADIDELCGEH